jgi:hypothetical protein
MLISSGMFAFPDESRYDGSLRALFNLRKLDLNGFLHAIFSTDARPGDAFIRIISAFLQRLSTKLFNIDFFDPHNTYPIFVFNYIIHLSILVIHYKLSKRFFKEQLPALLSVLIFSSLTNSYFYLRHALPYDSSLLLLYFVLYQFTKYYNLHQITNKRLFNWGLIMTIAYLIYPGYSLFFASLSMVLLIMLYFEEGFIKSIKSFLIYIFSVCFVMVLTEILSRIGGVPYFGGIIVQITQGSFEESFSFIIKYLIQVEGLTGGILICGLAIYIISLIYNSRKLDFKAISVITFFCFGSIFIFWATLGYFNKVVFYGRLIHQFIPLICIFAILPLDKLIISNRQKYLVLGIGTIATCVIISFSMHLKNYLNIAYPRDTYYSFVKQGTNHRELTEFNNIWDFRYYYRNKTNNNTETNNKGADIILLNNYFYYPFKNVEQTDTFISNDYKIIYSKLHFLNFKAYQFEGYDIEARKNFDYYNLHIKVYKKIPAANNDKKTKGDKERAMQELSSPITLGVES